jgi:hypothetical protein
MKKDFMATQFRGIWVLYQGPTTAEGNIKLIARRTFPTVEKRAKASYLLHGRELPMVPSDEAILHHFSTCILSKRRGGDIRIDHLSGSLSSEISGRVFACEPEDQASFHEKEWPLGPTLKISDSWPFIFVTNDGTYEELSDNGRLVICGLVLVGPDIEKAPLMRLPELTAAFGVLKEISKFFPPSTNTIPSEASISRFHFLVKTALPFGAPFITDLDTLNLIDQNNISSNDAQILMHCSTGPGSSVRIPAWKPFPLFSGGSFQVKINVTESVSFDVLDGEVRHCSVSGTIVCDNDLFGTPEVIIPVHVTPGQQSLVLHDCSKLVNSVHDDVLKISFVPPNGAFNLCSFSMSTPLKVAQFPLDLSFRLLQISPTQFKFDISAKLRVLFSHFSVLFCVNKNVPIASIALRATCPKWKADVSHETHVLWTLKNPATYSDGETIDGVVETTRPLLSTEEISRFAVVSFRISSVYFSKLKILKETISFFPPIPKANVKISYETVSTGGCLILNSAVDNGPSVSTPIDLRDCLDLSNSVASA